IGQEQLIVWTKLLQDDEVEHLGSIGLRWTTSERHNVFVSSGLELIRLGPPYTGII
ncbi:hypothetical protein ACJX0J_040426, partial [Zea mays]